MNRDPIEFYAESVEALDEVAGQILEWAGAHRKFFLKGDLGAGKTALVQAFCRHLGFDGAVSSPTFSLINIYPGSQGPIRHMDLYRLKNLQEALDIGVEDYLFDTSYCFVEWPDCIEELGVPDPVIIQIEIAGDTVRKLLISSIESMS